MSATPSTARIERLCKQYGPGRLPGSDRPAIGAGYAFATAALSVTLVFTVLTGLRTLVFDGPYALPGSLAMFGLLAVPLVIPTAFAAGALAWRLVPGTWGYRGPIGGVVATLLTYVGATALVTATIFGWMLLSPTTTVDPERAVQLAALFGGVGFGFTFWLTLPAGALSGWVHEQATQN